MAGYEVTRLSAPQTHARAYNQDLLITYHNHDFIKDPDFMSAYQRGVKACNIDYGWHWRVHVGLWIASHVKHLDGDFVECGVNRGFLSSAVMTYINWNALNKRFFLFDTFSGLDERYVNEVEKRKGRLDVFKPIYTDCYEEVKANFAEFENIHLIRGSVPDTLSSIDISKVCYLAIDMNCTEPEIAAATFFWDKLVSGAMVLLDDYAYWGYEAQKKAFDKFASERGIKILSLPTGQGLFIKP